MNIVNLFLVVVILAIILVGAALFLLNSKLLSNTAKERLRKFLFILAPEYGWGVGSTDDKKEQRFWLLFAILCLIVGLVILFFTLR